ncbi:MAG: hypothetical protein WCL49_13420 [bacterium]
MKRNIFTILGMLTVAGVVYAAPWAQTYPLKGATVAVTNQHLNTVWMPEVVLWKFAVATNATLTVSRVSQGNTYLIGSLSVTNASTVVWIPEADFPFEYGDALQLSSTVTNGQVQIIRKGN